MALEATKTVFVTVTAQPIATGTPFPKLSPHDRQVLSRSTWIAQWVAIAVFGCYILFFLCIASTWICRRLRYHRIPVSNALPPEATQHDRVALLASSKRRGTGGSSWSALSVETRNTGSMFYEGPGTLVEETTIESGDIGEGIPRFGRDWTTSQMTVIPLQTQTPPPCTPSHTQRNSLPRRYSPPRIQRPLQHSYGVPQRNSPPRQYQGIPQYDGPEVYTRPETKRPIKARIRSSSQSTLRYCVTQNEQEGEPIPTLPTVALLGQQSEAREWRQRIDTCTEFEMNLEGSLQK